MENKITLQEAYNLTVDIIKNANCPNVGKFEKEIALKLLDEAVKALNEKQQAEQANGEKENGKD